jgi:hypothetical protein
MHVSPIQTDPRLLAAQEKASRIKLFIPKALKDKKSRDQMTEASVSMLRRKMTFFKG